MILDRQTFKSRHHAGLPARHCLRRGCWQAGTLPIREVVFQRVL